MMREWREVRLGDVCEIRRGSSPRPIVDYLSKTTGMPWVKIADATETNSRYIWKTNQFIKYEGVGRSVIVEKGDLILSNSGTAGLPKFMGITACIHDGWQVLRELKGVTSGYLYYSLIYLRSSLLHNAYDSTMKNLTLDMVRDAKINLPPMKEQLSIAHILGTLDDKIEVNRQMNATLESMAQALFKSWFVDFDPVIDNALAAGNPIPEPLQARAEVRQALGDKRKPLPEAIQQQFPDQFVFTEEMGWVPEGWDSIPLGDALELAYGKSLPAPKRIEGKVPVYGSGGLSGYHNEALVQGPAIVVGRKGTVGSLYWVDDPLYPIDTVFYVKQKIDYLPLYWIFQTLQQLDIKSMGADSAVPGVNRNAVYGARIMLAPEEVLRQYWKFISSIPKKVMLLGAECKSLSSLRDTLLPKLLSGELRIPDAEKLIAEVE